MKSRIRYATYRKVKTIDPFKMEMLRDKAIYQAQSIHKDIFLLRDVSGVVSIDTVNDGSKMLLFVAHG